jgi:pimeloyl-ACP methyl ester carboxylesterase
MAFGTAGVAIAEFVSADGIRLAYETAGVGDPPIVFVHGWSCDRSYFTPQFEYFAARHAVGALDLRGHGGSGRPDPDSRSYDIDVLADDVLAMAGAAGFSRPVLAGHSLGALIGLACAARPGAIRALVMVEPAPITNDTAKTFFLDSVAAVRGDDDRSWRTAFIEGMFLGTDTVRREAILNEMLDVSPGIAAALMRAMGEFNGASALSKTSVPVLSIGSAVPANKSADLRRLCPPITIGQTVGAGHFNHLEVPQQVNAMIERFLAINDLSPHT